MTTNHKSKTRAEILQELESIQGLLLEDDDIPLLNEVVTPSQPQANTAKSDPTTRPPVKANGENPFLPQHIRSRLKGSNPPLEQLELPHSQPSTPAVSVTREGLIQAVIEGVQAQIERELRQRLRELSAEDLQKLLDEE